LIADKEEKQWKGGGVHAEIGQDALQILVLLLLLLLLCQINSEKKCFTCIAIGSYQQISSVVAAIFDF
jgi:hypothetical protein